MHGEYYESEKLNNAVRMLTYYDGVRKAQDLVSPFAATNSTDSKVQNVNGVGWKEIGVLGAVAAAVLMILRPAPAPVIQQPQSPPAVVQPHEDKDTDTNTKYQFYWGE